MGKPLRRRPRIAIAAVLALLVLLGGLVVSSLGPETDAPSPGVAATEAVDAAPATRERTRVQPQPGGDDAPRSSAHQPDPTAPAAARELRVVVVDAATREPVGGALVLGQWGDEFTCDAAGVARIPDPPTGVSFVAARASTHIGSGWQAADTRGSAGAAVTIALERGAGVHGTVFDSDSGLPVAGARIDLRGGIGSSIFADPVLATAETGADGAFTLDGAPTGRAWTLVVSSDRHVRRLVPMHRDALVPESLRIELSPSATLIGHVVHADGSPAVRATVRAVPRDRPDLLEKAASAGMFMGRPPWLETRADASGAFRLEGLRAGVLHVAIAIDRESGATPPSDVLTPGALPDDLILTLPASASLRVRVTVPPGATLPTEIVVRRGTRRTRLESAREDGGEYVFPSLAPGEHDIRVEAAGWLPVQTRAVVAEGEHAVLDVVLVPGGQVSGVVVDVDGAPIAGARVTVRGGDAEQRGVTGPDGTFRLEGLPAEVLRVSAHADGHSGAGVDAIAPTDDVRLTLDRTALVTLRVRLPEGAEPVRGNVLYQLHRGRDGVDPHGREAWSRRIGGLDFEDGVATIRWETLGRSRLIVFTREFAPVMRYVSAGPGETLDLGEVTLGPGRSIAGRVVDETGRAIANASIDVPECTTSVHRAVTTDASGAFRLTLLADGPVPARVTAERHGEWSGDLDPSAARRVVLSRRYLVVVRVEAESGAPAQVEHIECVRLENGVEREAHGLSPARERPGEWRADLAAGVYRLRLPGGASQVVEIDDTDPPVVILRSE